MLVTRGVLASIVLLIGISNSLAKEAPAKEAAESTDRVLDGVRWVGPAVTLEALRGKTVVVLDYATWCPKCNAWSGEVCKQIKEAIQDKPVVVLAINNDETPGNVRPYLETREFFAPNIIHGYDPKIAKRNGLPDLWGYMIIDPQGKITEKGQVGTYFGGGDTKVYVLTKKLQEKSGLGEFVVIDAKMPDTVKKALWPMELGLATGADLRKFSGDQKQQVDAALARYGDKELKSIRTLTKGEADEKLTAYDRATALGLQLKGTDSAKEAKKVLLALEADATFKRELLAKKAYERCVKMPSTSISRATALKVLIKRFDGTHYAEKAKAEVGAPTNATAKASA